MMGKRNTEGYVLAYLLIVIAVMGSIAATLMTSTVHILSAQQNSIRYTEDKYAAQGEVEKLVLTLELKSEESLSDDGFESPTVAEEAAKTALISFFQNYSVPDASKDTGWTAWTESTSSYSFDSTRVPAPDNPSTTIPNYTFTAEMLVGEACVTATYQLLFDDEHYSIDINEYAEDNPNYEEEFENWETNGGTEPSQTITKYEYDITDVKFEIVSYEVTSNGGDT